MKENILVVGGTGFLGYHLCKSLLKKNFNITVVSLKPPKKLRFLNKIKYIRCNIAEKKQVKKKLRNNYSYVFNLGGHVDHKNKKKTMLSHYNGTKNLVNHITNSKLKLFLQIGSGLEYGKNKSPQIEKNISKPISNYAKAKYYASRFLLENNKKKRFPCVIVRPYQVYGPKQDTNRIIPIVINGCLKNISFPCSSGKQYRDFLYVDDFNNFLLKVLKNKKKCLGQIFNVGIGKAYKIKKIINFIHKKINKGQPMFGKIKLRAEESEKLFQIIKKAKKIINWTPRISIEKGLIKTINSYRKEF